MTWEERALCAALVKQEQADPEWWFPRSKGGSSKAAKICKFCPVRSQCLLFALSTRVYGVWGGRYIGPNRVKSAYRDISGELIDDVPKPEATSSATRDERGRYIPKD